jgi:hypothetical protein
MELRLFGKKILTNNFYCFQTKIDSRFVSVSFGLQVWSHHKTIPRRFLKTSFMPLADCFPLLALAAHCWFWNW